MTKISAQAFDQIQAYLDQLIETWKSQQAVVSKTWFSFNNVYLVKITTFLLKSIDGLINFVEPLIEEGTDKKAAVMTIVSQLFDSISKNAFPVILTPFVPLIKKVLIDIFVSNTIDFFVEKYNEGAWKTTDTTTN